MSHKYMFPISIVTETYFYAYLLFYIKFYITFSVQYYIIYKNKQLKNSNPYLTINNSNDLMTQ